MGSNVAISCIIINLFVFINVSLMIAIRINLEKFLLLLETMASSSIFT